MMLHLLPTGSWNHYYAARETKHVSNLFEATIYNIVTVNINGIRPG